MGDDYLTSDPASKPLDQLVAEHTEEEIVQALVDAGANIAQINIQILRALSHTLS